MYVYMYVWMIIFFNESDDFNFLLLIYLYILTYIHTYILTFILHTYLHTYIYVRVGEDCPLN